MATHTGVTSFARQANIVIPKLSHGCSIHNPEQQAPLSRQRGTTTPTNQTQWKFPTSILWIKRQKTKRFGCPLPATRILVLLLVPALTSTVWAIRSYDAQFKELRDMLGPLVRGFTDFENHVKTILDAVCLFTSRITKVEQIVNTFSAKMVSFAEMEQNVNSLTARMCKIETNAASASSGPGTDGSTAAGSP